MSTPKGDVPPDQPSPAQAEKKPLEDVADVPDPDEDDLDDLDGMSR